jgi:methyltransferase
MVTAYLALLLAVVGERTLELVVSRRNAAWAFARGGVESGRRHFPVMVLLHTAFLASCAVEVVALRRPFHPALAGIMLAVVVAAQALRWWAIATLGPRWNVRVIVVPGLPVVTGGPYRWLRHPNYLAVVLEGVALPMVHTAWITAVTFSVLNAILLATRMRCEEAALDRHADYGAQFAARGRLLPRARGALRSCEPTWSS